MAEMIGSVSLKGFNDIKVEASDLTIYYDKSIAKTDKPVFMNGKFGLIQAGNAKFYDRSYKSDIGYVLSFGNGVRMLYNLGNN